MIYYLVTTLHVLVCVILILVVLLQSGKGADLAGAFGGGSSQTAFGSRGPASFLSKLTTGAAIIFMLTSITLNGITRQREARSILETTSGTAKAPAKAPATQVPAAPAAQVPTPDQIKQMQQQIETKQGTPAGQAPATAAPASQPQPAEKQSAPADKKP
jgi:preprotein translocase subunit SecG